MQDNPFDVELPTKSSNPFDIDIPVKKKVDTPASKNGSTPSASGLKSSPRSPDGLIVPFDTAPAIPTVLTQIGKNDYVNQQLQQSEAKQQAAKDLSDRLSKLHDSLPAEAKNKFEQAQKFSIASLGRDNVREVSPEEEEHEKFMDSGMGKVLGTTKYLGGKATKGLISVAKGAAGLAGDLLGDKDYDEATKALFDKAMKMSDFGMTENDTYQMENGKGGLLLSNLGGATEFGAPAMVGGALKAPAMATFALQGLGMAKEETENLEKEGKKLDPGVKLLYEYGTAGLMSLMGRSGGLFGKMPVGLRKDIVGTVSANLIKEAATKKLDGLAFKTLLEKTAMSLEDKTAQALMELGEGYKKAVTDLTALNIGGEALRKGADKLNSEEVFKHDPAQLLASTFDIITKAAPIFGGLHGIKGFTKLTKYSEYKNAVVENLMADPSPQNVELIKQQLAEHGTATDKVDQWTPEEVQATQEHVQEIADVAGKLKTTEKAFGGAIPKNKLVDAVDLVNGRTELQERLKSIQDGKKDLDESVKEKETPLEVDYQNKIDQANDLLSNMIVGGDPIRYVFDQSDKKYYKKRGSEVIDEISKERYDLEKGEEQYKKADKQEENESKTNKDEGVQEQPIEETIPETVGEVPTEVVEPAEAAPIVGEENVEVAMEPNTVRLDNDARTSDILQRDIKPEQYKPVDEYEHLFEDKDIFNIVKKSGLKVVLLTPEMKKNNPLLDVSGGKYLFGNTILIAPEYLTKEHLGANVIQHEAAHAFTVNVLLEKDLSKLNSHEIKFREGIKEAYKKNKTPLIDRYGLKNELEFVAEIYSNKGFRDYLKNENISLWEKVVKLLSGVFNVDNSKIEKLFSDFKDSFKTPEKDGKIITEALDTKDAPKDATHPSPDIKTETVEAPIEFKNQAEADRHSIENETDPKKLAARFHTEFPNEPDYIEQGIMDYMGNSKINERDYVKNGDRNNIIGDDEFTKKRIDKENKSINLDTAAQELSGQLGVEVEPGDIIETITKYRDAKGFKESLKSENQRLIKERYKELTGKNLTPSMAERAHNSAKFVPKTDKQLFEANDKLKEIGITYDDIKRYEEYSSASDGGSAGDIRKATDQSGSTKEGSSDTSPQKSKSDLAREKVKSAEDDFMAFIKGSMATTNMGANLAEFTAKATKLLAAYAELGIVKLDDVIKKMRSSFGDDFIDENIDAIIDTHKDFNKKEPLSIVKEETRLQRAERGLADVLNSGTKKLTESFEGGKALLADATFDVREFARSLATGRREGKKLDKLNISDDEVNALLIDRQTLRDERDDAYIQALKAKEAGDPIGEIKWKGVIERAEAYLDDNEQAVYNGAKANARALSAMRTMIDADYQPDTQRARMKRKWGRELTPEMKAELGRYDEELKKAKEQLAEFEKIKSDKAARAAFMRQFKEEQVARKGKVVEDKQTIRKEREVIVADFLKEMKKLSGAANDAAYAAGKAVAIAAPFMKKMVTSLIKEGIVEFEDIVKTIKETFEEHIEGLKDKDILDVLSGVYDEHKATKNELLVQKNAILRMAKLTNELDNLKAGIETEKVERRIAKKHQRILDLEEQIKELEKQAKIDNTVILSPNEKKQQNLKTKLDEINGKLKSGDFERPAKREAIELDAQTIHMQAKVKKAQNNYEAMAARLDKHNEDGLQKTLNAINDLNRAFLLSGIKTLGKLYSYALGKSVITPIEELFNTMNSKLPGVQKIAQKSPRYAGGWDARAEARAITSRWSKSTIKDSWWSKGSVVRTGAGELDRLYGKHGVDLEFENPTPQKIEFFGRLHGAFKNSTKRAEFFRSFEKRLQYEADRGKDIRDESLQYVVAMESYADGKRAILMNDNIMTDTYKGTLRTLESKGTYGKLGAFLFRTLLPIVKIPTNYVLETLYFASGGLSAMPELIKAAIKGADSLTPKEADHAMRKIAKGQIGLAAMAYAWMNPQMFGGYYSGKRKDEDSKPGDLTLFGIHIWHNLAHNPLLEAMQVAATARRAYDAAHGADEGQGIAETLTTKIRDEIVEKAVKSADKNTRENQIIPVQYNSTDYEVHIKDGKMSRIEKSDWERQAGGDVIGGLSSQVPFLNMPAQVSRSFSTDKGLETFGGDMLRNRIEPRLLQEVAEFMDKDENGETVKRDPQKFLDYIKEGIPVWRKSVPKKADLKDAKVSEIKIGTDTWVLSPETLKERKGYMDEFKKEYGEEITSAYKEAGKTQKDIDKFIQEKALEYSLGRLADEPKYQDGESFKFGKLKDD